MPAEGWVAHLLSSALRPRSPCCSRASFCSAHCRRLLCSSTFLASRLCFSAWDTAASPLRASTASSRAAFSLEAGEAEAGGPRHIRASDQRLGGEQGKGAAEATRGRVQGHVRTTPSWSVQAGWLLGGGALREPVNPRGPDSRASLRSGLCTRGLSSDSPERPCGKEGTPACQGPPHLLAGPRDLHPRQS